MNAQTIKERTNSLKWLRELKLSESYIGIGMQITIKVGKNDTRPISFDLPVSDQNNTDEMLNSMILDLKDALIEDVIIARKEMKSLEQAISETKLEAGPKKIRHEAEFKHFMDGGEIKVKFNEADDPGWIMPETSEIPFDFWRRPDVSVKIVEL